jgi:hypothetical protein
MRLERRGFRVEVGAGNGGSRAGVGDTGSGTEAEDTGSGAGTEGTGSGAEVEDTGSGTGTEGTGSEGGGGGFGAGDEGLRPLGGFSISGSIQNKRLRPSSSSSSISSGLDSRSGNPSISRRVGRSSRLGSKGALSSGSLSWLVDIAGGVTAPIVMVVPS